MIGLIIAALAAVIVGAAILASALSEAGDDADSNFSDGAVDGDSQPCPHDEDEEPRIVSVEFLDGDDDTELSALGNHYVNLPRDEDWVDGMHVQNIDRLSSETRIKVRFNIPGRHSFKVRYEPASGNTEYSDDEKDRNDNFLWFEEEEDYSTRGNGTKIIDSDFFVTSAGNDNYRLIAEDDYGNPPVESSHSIDTYRLFYLKEIKMTGLTSIASNVNTLIAEYANHNITLCPTGSINVEHLHNIGSSADIDTLKDNARDAYNDSGARDKEPYMMTIVYTNHQAVKNPNKTIHKDNVTVGEGAAAVDVVIRGRGLRSGDGVKDRCLWKNIVPGEGWFVSATFTPSGSGTTPQTIAEAQCTAVPVSSSRPDKCKIVRVDVSGIAASATGRLSLTVNWVDRMRAGLASSGNMVIICTRAWWRNKSTADQNQVMIHEIGHKLGMVADGSGDGPDAVSSLYVDSGHVGKHCHEGVPEQDSYSGATGSTCVMFGSTNGRNAFCANCAPAMRKLDISEGWRRF